MADFTLTHTDQDLSHLSPDERFIRAHEILRDNGCHSPTRESIIVVFRALKRLCLHEKMRNENGRVTSVSMEHLVRILNGPDAKINITGNGMEFTGWWSEIALFQFAQLIFVGRGYIGITPAFLSKFCGYTSETDEEVYERLHDHLKEFHIMLRQMIVERCIAFKIVHYLIELGYSGREAIAESDLRSDQHFECGFRYPRPTVGLR